ncbi:hypothetical protein [Sorangium sp. So ce590]|uniref:hypothetical protein n=1 Tax=unclassified Sorangium TaxID=2621164 RepID=UPI003F5EE6B1
MTTGGGAPVKISGPKLVTLHRLSLGSLPSSGLLQELVELRAVGSKPRVTAGTLRVDGDTLIVSCDVDSPDGSLSDIAREDLSRLQLEGRCKDGATFSARNAAVRSWKKREERVCRVELTYDDWAIRWPAARPLLWAGITDAALPSSNGNLDLVAERGPTSRHRTGDSAQPALRPGHRTTAGEGTGSWRHYCLEGPSYTYYLVHCAHRGETRWILALDPRDATTLDRDVLRRDLTCIAFCFGQPFHVGVLHGLDGDGGRAGLFRMGVEARLPGRQRERPPVPLRGDDAPWPVALFTVLSSHVARDDAQSGALAAAVTRFVEAIHETSTEGAALKLLHGASMAARSVLGDEALQAADRQRWNDWFAQHRGRIEARKGPALSAELLASLQRAEQGRASALIRAAFAKVRLAPLDEIDAALSSAEAYLLGEDKARPDGRSAAILQAVLVALVAKAVGYKGPICAWERSPSEPSDAPSRPWWPAERSAGKRIKRFVAPARARQMPRDMRDSWPFFVEPKVPIQGPIAAIASFAEGLEAKANGLVTASVKPVAPAPGELATFEFVLAPVGKPKARILLLKIHETLSGAIKIEDWSNRERTFTRESKIASFVTDLAHSDETRQLVEGLMLAAREPPEP